MVEFSPATREARVRFPANARLFVWDNAIFRVNNRFDPRGGGLSIEKPGLLA